MKLMQAVKMAFKAIASNKMRSFLTMLGIIIGVLSVSMLISVGEATTSSVTSQIQGLGSNMLTVSITSRKPYELSLDALSDADGNPVECANHAEMTVLLKTERPVAPGAIFRKQI